MYLYACFLLNLIDLRNASVNTIYILTALVLIFGVNIRHKGNNKTH